MFTVDFSGPIITMTAPTATGGATATAGVSTGAQAVGYRSKLSTFNRYFTTK